MKIRGKTWCSACNKKQPSSFVSLQIEGSQKIVHGFCSVCEEPVQRTIQSQIKKRPPSSEKIDVANNNCVPLYPKEDNKASTKQIIESPSWLILLAISSACIVLTFFL